MAAMAMGLPRQAMPLQSTCSERAARHPSGSRLWLPDHDGRTGASSKLISTPRGSPTWTKPSPSSPHQPGNPAVGATTAASARRVGFGTLDRSAAAVAVAARPLSPSRRAQAARPAQASAKP